MSSIITTAEHTSPPPTTMNSIVGNNRVELALWICLLILVNRGLFVWNTPSVNLTFDPTAVASGEWWRTILSPFVHVSRYHLMMDGTAFLLVYGGLEEKHWYRRLTWTFFSAAGSLLLPLAVSPQLYQIGLCGLSGAAHGLTAISALEMLRYRHQRKLGAILFTTLLLKTTWEMWSGTVFLQSLHFGDIGHPIVATHAGGVLGGIIGYGLTIILARNFPGVREKSPVWPGRSKTLCGFNAVRKG